MNTIKINKKNCKMIAHRGLSGIEVENTKEAFIAAGNRSYYGIETDISVTKDNKFVIFHDPDLKRLGNLDKKVTEMSLEEILSINLIHNNNYTDSKNHALSYEDFLKIVERYDISPIVELKYGFSLESLKYIIEALKKHNIYDKSTIISFSYDYLKTIRAFDKTIKLQLLLGKFKDVSIDELKKLNISVDINYQGLSKELVDELHENGLEVNVWTVDNKDLALEYIEMGVDYITTNILEWL